LIVQLSKSFRGDKPPIEGNIKQGLDLRCGAKGILQKSGKFPVATGIKALCNVGHRGYSSPTHLLSEREVSAEDVPTGQIMHHLGELPGLLPTSNVFESLNRHVFSTDFGRWTLDLGPSHSDDFLMFPEDPSEPRANLADGRIRLDRRQKGGEEIDVASGRRLELG